MTPDEVRKAENEILRCKTIWEVKALSAGLTSIPDKVARDDLLAMAKRRMQALQNGESDG